MIFAKHFVLSIAVVAIALSQADGSRILRRQKNAKRTKSPKVSKGSKANNSSNLIVLPADLTCDIKESCLFCLERGCYTQGTSTNRCRSCDDERLCGHEDGGICSVFPETEDGASDCAADIRANCANDPLIVLPTELTCEIKESCLVCIRRRCYIDRPSPNRLCRFCQAGSLCGHEEGGICSDFTMDGPGVLDCAADIEANCQA